MLKEVLHFLKDLPAMAIVLLVVIPIMLAVMIWCFLESLSDWD